MAKKTAAKRAAKKVTALARRRADAAAQNAADGTESPLATFERMASDKGVDVEKFERFMQMREREIARIAKEQFNVAISAAQGEIRRIAADADNPQTRSKYASYAALDRVLRPIYIRHGFGLSFNTEDSPLAENLRVLCDVTHIAGHAKRYQIDIPADGKGAKGGDVMTKTHAVGAAASYGMRYLLKMIWNVAVGEDDDDGNSAQPPMRRAPAQRSVPPSAGSDGNGDLHISPAQSRRLFSMATKEAGRDWKNEVLPWLKSAYNAVETGTKPDRYLTLARTEYTAVCETVIAPGPLPKGRA